MDKSREYAVLFNDYIRANIDSDLAYRSPFFDLHDLHEFEVARLAFEGDTESLHHITSCNNSTPEKNWCCVCPKCAFSYALMRIYHSREELLDMFPVDPFDDLSLFREQMDPGVIKPRECVGLQQELWLALYRIAMNEGRDAPVVRYFMEMIFPKIEDTLPEMERQMRSIHGNDLFWDGILPEYDHYEELKTLDDLHWDRDGDEKTCA